MLTSGILSLWPSVFSKKIVGKEGPPKSLAGWVYQLRPSVGRVALPGVLQRERQGGSTGRSMRDTGGDSFSSQAVGEGHSVLIRDLGVTWKWSE